MDFNCTKHIAFILAGFGFSSRLRQAIKNENVVCDRNFVNENKIFCSQLIKQSLMMYENPEPIRCKANLRAVMGQINVLTSIFFCVFFQLAQPPGVPEICKKSLSTCPASGGLEMFILGKNFLKDTRVVFSEGDIGTEGSWEVLVHPDKEFLQQVS